ncbi:hypothetical protein NIES4101_29570 [Calothrix sp. NIES-4101]|nr:hypothetical protein NIES4101_29570 [Calothrix sp. NIES-4101]
MKYISRLFGGLLAISCGLSLQNYSVANASSTFAQPPRLVGATTPYTDTSIWGATYYFTIEVPATAKESLQKVTFTQTEGVEEIEFNQKDTVAWEGTGNSKGEKLAVTTTTNDNQQQTLTVTFEQAIAPGKTVTIGLKPYKNPLSDGIYLFGVKAFPSGEQATGQFLGFGRFQFYAPASFNTPDSSGV